MNYNLNQHQQSKFNLKLIKSEIKELERVIFENNIEKEKAFIKWQEDFELIYGSKYTNIHLYITFALLYFTGHYIISIYVLNTDDLVFNEKNFTINIKKLQYRINNKFKNFVIFDCEYFNPILKLIDNGELSSFPSLIKRLANYIFKLEIEPFFKFDFLIQNVISSIIRHKSGEFYTMPFLVKKMIEESYIFGERVLDPCCGSGNFLIEIIKRILSTNKSEEQKISAINNIYGYDINPISIFITKINFLILLKGFPSKIQVNLYVMDSIFPQEKNIKKVIRRKDLANTFDLVIGNPPWYTFRDIDSIEYQNKVKILAENLGIKPLPKNILNIEISALFFYQAKEIYLKDHGKIFFVITKGVITGSHASRFRNFQGFKNIKVWSFEKKIEKIFNIDFICLFAQKSENESKFSNKQISEYLLNIKNKTNNIDYFDNLELKIGTRNILVPYFIEKRGNKFYTKKLISQKLNKVLLPYGESFYKNFFHKGADLNPRNLIFVKYKKLNESLVKINPEDRIFKRAKAPWNTKEFKDEIIEKKYIFNVIKSTELLKFHVFDFYHVFLPLSKKDLKFNYNGLSENAKHFYDKINQIYLKNKKKTTKNNSLMENLNRWSKLINAHQQSNIKVVYNNSGSLLNSSVVIGDFIITGDLSFYDTDNIDEAYYLTSILNSNLTTQQVKIRKSSRHIFKIPFEIPIKEFDPNSQHHKKLAELGKKCSKIAEITTKELIKKTNHNISKTKLQKILIIKLKPFLRQIDDILQLEFH